MDEKKLEHLKDQIRDFTKLYLHENGVDINGRNIKCLNPEHDDHNPSMGYMEEINKLHCFSCNAVYDIFSLANLFENKPLTGKPFILENMFYLAKKYDIPYEHINVKMTPEDREKMKQYRIMELVEEHVINNINEIYLENRKIKLDTAKTLSIGSANFPELKQKLLSENGINNTDLNKLGIKETFLNQNKLIFIIKNHYGRPISFSSREMMYTDKQIKNKTNIQSFYENLQNKNLSFKKLMVQYSNSEQITFQEKKLIDRKLKTPKYINGKNSLIFNKKEMLYGFDHIKNKINPYDPFLLVEGYTDFITAVQAGFHNISCVGGLGFTDQHMKIIEKNKYINQPVIAYDEDEAGENRKKAIKEQIKNSKNITKSYKIGFLKNEKNIDKLDLDLKLRTMEEKPKELKNLYEIYSLFEYALKNLLNNDMSEKKVLELIIPILIKEDSPLEVENKLNIISKYIKTYSRATIMSEIEYKKDAQTRNLSNIIDNIMNKYKKQISMEPKNAITILDRAKMEIEEVEDNFFKKKDTPKSITSTHMKIIKKKKEKKEKINFEFGLPIFDDMDIKTKQVINIVAKANIGKTTLFVNITDNLLKLNNDTIVLYFSTDDSAGMIIHSLIAKRSGLPEDYVYDPEYHPKAGIRSNHKNKRAFYDAFQEAWSTYETKYITEQERFAITDSSDGSSINFLEQQIKSIKENPKHSNSNLVVIVDSVNKVEVPGITDSNQKVEYISSRTKKLATNYDCLIFQNQELVKTKKRVKADYTMQKGSARAQYDPTAIVTLHQPLHELEQDASLFWEHSSGRAMPTLVGLIEKSKIGGEKNKPYIMNLDGFTKRLHLPKNTIQREEAERRWSNADIHKYTDYSK